MFRNADAGQIVNGIAKTIQENKDYLGKIDGLIADGDHGTNMNKGFSLFLDRFSDTDLSFTDSLYELGMILLSEIGGSMGPIYGTFFIDMANKGTPEEEITTEVFAKMLEASRDGLHEIIEARVGDKTLMDTLEPAVQALKAAVDAGESFPNALEAMRRSAELGMESTENMIANYGRSSRIGERSRGVLDAGATSCYLILTAFARGITEIDS